MFASKTPRDLNRDPRPLSTIGTGRRVAVGSNYAGETVPNPRPEYDHPQHNEPNPILLELRRTWREDRAHHENDLQLCADRVLMSDVEEPAAAEHFTPEQRDHAERVLSRLIAILEPHRPAALS